MSHSPSPTDEPDQLLTIDEVSELTRIPVNSLRSMRQRGAGPEAARLGKRLVYRRSAVLAWIDERFAAAKR